MIFLLTKRPNLGLILPDFGAPGRWHGSPGTQDSQVHEGFNSQYSLSPLVWEVDMFFPKLEGLIATEGTQTWQLSSGPPILCPTSHMSGQMVMN